MELCIYTILLILFVYVFLLYSVAYLSYINPQRLNLRYTSYKEKLNPDYIINIMAYEDGKKQGRLEGEKKVINDINKISEFINLNGDSHIPVELYPNPYDELFKLDKMDKTDHWKFGYKIEFYQTYTENFDSFMDSLSEEYKLGIINGKIKGSISGSIEGKRIAQTIIKKENLAAYKIDVIEYTDDNSKNNMFMDFGLRVGFSKGYLETIGRSFLTELKLTNKEKIYTFIEDERYVSGLINGFMVGYISKSIDDSEVEKTLFESVSDFIVTSGGEKRIKNPTFIAIPDYIKINSLESNGYEIGHEIGYNYLSIVSTKP